MYFKMQLVLLTLIESVFVSSSCNVLQSGTQTFRRTAGASTQAMLQAHALQVNMLLRVVIESIDTHHCASLEL